MLEEENFSESFRCVPSSIIGIHPTPIPVTIPITASPIIDVREGLYQAYIENLTSHDSYAKLAVVAEKRGVNFAEQAVRLFDNYLNSVFSKNANFKNNIENFLFSDSVDNPIAIEYIRDTRVDKLSQLKINLSKKKQESTELKNSLAKIMEMEIETERKHSICSIEKKEDILQSINQDFTNEQTESKTPSSISSISSCDDFIEEENKISKKINTINEELQQLTETVKIEYEMFLDLCIRLSCAKTREVKVAISQKNEKLTNKLLYLLKRFNKELLPEKSPLIKQELIAVKETDGFTIEVLSGVKLLEAISFGITTPCCLSVPASGTKYLYAILFDPNVSMAVVKDKNRHAIATSLLTVNKEDRIGLWHIDASKFYKPTIDPISGKTISGKTNEELVNNKKKVKASNIKKAFETLGDTLSTATGRDVFIAPGEATLTNLGYLTAENTTFINDLLRKDLLRQGTLRYLTESDMEQKIGASVGSGRTDVGAFKYLAYSLENLSELSVAGKEALNDFITRITGWNTTEKYTEAAIEADIFELNKDDGHGLCKLQFIYKNKEKQHRKGQLAIKKSRSISF